MLGRDEFGVGDLLSYSNWMVFCPKMVKIVSFWPKMTQNEHLSGVSPNYVLLFPNFYI